MQRFQISSLLQKTATLLPTIERLNTPPTLALTPDDLTLNDVTKQQTIQIIGGREATGDHSLLQLE